MTELREVLARARCPGCGKEWKLTRDPGSRGGVGRLQVAILCPCKEVLADKAKKA